MNCGYRGGKNEWLKAPSRYGPRQLKAHCKNGHPLSGGNLSVAISGSRKGRRYCRACRQEAHHRWYYKDVYHARMKNRLHRMTRRLTAPIMPRLPARTQDLSWFCRNLDDVDRLGISLHEKISAPILNPLELLMIKESCVTNE